MDALTLINEHTDIHALMEHYQFSSVRAEGNMIRSACKLHGGNNPSAFVANPETGLWYCHTGDCGGGDIYTLVQRIEECSFTEAVRIVANLFNVDIENLQITERKNKTVKELQNWVTTMKSWTRKKEQEVYSIDVPMRTVKKFRDFQPETLEHFGLGFVDEISLEKSSGGFYTLRNRLVIPIIQGERQVGASFRKTKAQDYPKWSHQPRSIRTGDLLYNYDATKGQPIIAVVEGSFDVWAFHEIGVTAVATYGAHITNEQYKLLMKTGADLVFAYDGDKAGQDATQKALELFRYKANLFTVPFGEEEDPASVSRETLQTLYESRNKLC